MYPGEYCSRQCVNDAYSLKKSGEPFSKVPESAEPSTKEVRKTVPHLSAEDFGDVGVIRHFCDNLSCTNPGSNPVMEIDGKMLTVITLCWRSHHGEYCSNECLKSEKEKKMTDDQNDSPVSAGDSTPAPKKAAKKASAKKAAPVAAKKADKKVAKAASAKKVAKKAAPVKKAAKKSAAHNGNGNGARNGSKTSELIAMLNKKGGATLDDIMTKFGWLPHTTRAMLSAGGPLAKKHGLTVISEKINDKRTYHV
jgi:hypothetical protein